MRLVFVVIASCGVCAAMRRILVRKVFVGCGFCVFLEGVEVNFDREGQIIMVCDEDIFGFSGLRCQKR